MALVDENALANGQFAPTVSEGSVVTKGARLGSLFNYGIQIPLWSPAAGTITFVQSPGQVMAGDVLFTVETATTGGPTV
jgi:predicted deacylase